MQTRNALSIDLEDYFHLTAFSTHADPRAWDACASRLEHNTERTLELLDAHGCRATFFSLGWVAEKYPRLIRRISEAGHEIACHSHAHQFVYELSVAAFREDTRRAKRALEDASGAVVRGYRAPSFSITRGSLWALEVLAETGFAYDSSIFPVRHPNYGMPCAPRFPFRVRTSHGSLVEFPMATLALGSRRSPLGGGAYLRLLPYWFTRWGIRFVNEHERQPTCVYLHPWELDPDLPRLSGSLTSRIRTYVGLRSVEAKMHRLLSDFVFVTLWELVQQIEGVGSDLLELAGEDLANN